MPKITTDLRKDIVKVPKVIREASGIQIFGKQIAPFTTDIAIIRNTNADCDSGLSFYTAPSNHESNYRSSRYSSVFWCRRRLDPRIPPLI